MRLQNSAVRLGEALGRVGLVGLVLLMGAIGWQLFVNRPLLAQGRALQAVMPAADAPVAAPVASSAMQLDGTDAAAAFAARLPHLQELPQLLARIDQGAAAQRVELRAGEYRLERRPDERWLRYRITLPVRARYAQVRGLVDHVLVELPTAALDEIELQRDGSDAQAPLQARLRFTLFLQP